MSRLGKPFYGEYMLDIRDEQGARVIDTHRHGAWMLGATPRMFYVVGPGRYTVQMYARGHRSDPVTFDAQPEVVVPVELVPLAAGAR
jgi:hypothetical protein